MKTISLFLFLIPGLAFADALEAGRKAVSSLMGCYLVDYSYTETHSLKEGYARDTRVYDVNHDKSVKEWIYAEEISPTHIRLQHILFATTLKGEFMEGSQLRHQAEDWQYNAPYLYDFVAPLTWQVKKLDVTADLWTRRITNLDDGLRYQCAAPWASEGEYAVWSCDNFSPIPGRETRDMRRKDYNTLERSTTVVAYGSSWLERQRNTKVIYSKEGEQESRTPLVKETGKNWYVRLPDGECAVVLPFVEARKGFWTLLREVWAEVLTGENAFVEKAIPGESRYGNMRELEEKYLSQELNELQIRNAVKKDILQIIEKYK